MSYDLNNIEIESLNGNPLSDTVEYFRNQAEDVYYVDRHVIESSNFENITENVVIKSVIITLRLAVKWNQEISNGLFQDLIFSPLICIIDDEWLEQDENAPPPHIKVNIAKAPKVKVPDPRDCMVMKQCQWPKQLEAVKSEVPTIQNWHIYRIEVTQDEKGAWIISPPLTTVF